MIFKICENGVLRDATPEESQQFIADKAANLIRKKFLARQERDQKLVETDWTQAADVSQVIKDKWAPYRQALRDVPQQAGFPDNVTWPTKPE